MSAPATIDPWLGEIPAERNNGGRPAKDHSGRWRKLHCERCGFIAQASAGALKRCGFPTCACGEPLKLANLRDRYAIEPDALETELRQLGADAYAAAMRELGEPVEREHGGRYGHSGENPRRRCQWTGGYCAKFVSGRFCPEHEHDSPAMGSAYAGRAA